MENLKFMVTYKNKIYSFQYGSEVYIFHTGIYNNIGLKRPKTLLKYVSLVHNCYLSDSNRTNLGALADYIAENLNKLKHLTSNQILEKYYTEADL